MFTFIYVSGFPSCYILMREQTTGRGTQASNSHIFVNKLSIVLATSGYIKNISVLKII